MQYLFLSLVLSLLVAIFAVQNSVAVTVAFLLWSFQTSLVIIILGAATFGAMVIISLATLAQFRLRRSIQKLKKENSGLEAENNALRAKLEQQALDEAAPDEGKTE